MNELAHILPQQAAFDPSGSNEAFFAAIPARWCVALLLDPAGQPLQLLCAKNLRAMLRRRLDDAPPPPIAEEQSPASPPRSRRIDYRQLVRSVTWQRVDGELEMDLVYIEAARVAFPAHWRRLIPERSSHFVRIDLDEPHPDFVRENDVDANGVIFGPFPDRAKADRWMENVRDAFDLCRYRSVLAQSPSGRACAYKQMSKCPAPCDGTVALADYQRGVREAVEAVRSPATMAERLSEQMKHHAARLEFEQAGRAKTRLATLQQLREGPFRSVRPIEAFRYVSIQPGPRKGTAKVFVMTARAVAEVAGVIASSIPFDLLRELVERAELAPSPWPSEVLMGTICHHLGGAKTAARFIAAHDLTPDVADSMLGAAMKAQPREETEGDTLRETQLQS